MNGKTLKRMDCLELASFMDFPIMTTHIIPILEMYDIAYSIIGDLARVVREGGILFDGCNGRIRQARHFVRGHPEIGVN